MLGLFKCALQRPADGGALHAGTDKHQPVICFGAELQKTAAAPGTVKNCVADTRNRLPRRADRVPGHVVSLKKATRPRADTRNENKEGTAL